VSPASQWPARDSTFPTRLLDDEMIVRTSLARHPTDLVTRSMARWTWEAGPCSIPGPLRHPRSNGPGLLQTDLGCHTDLPPRSIGPGMLPPRFIGPAERDNPGPLDLGCRSEAGSPGPLHLACSDVGCFSMEMMDGNGPGMLPAYQASNCSEMASPATGLSTRLISSGISPMHRRTTVAQA